MEDGGVAGEPHFRCSFVVVVAGVVPRQVSMVLAFPLFASCSDSKSSSRIIRNAPARNNGYGYECEQRTTNNE